MDYLLLGKFINEMDDKDIVPDEKHIDDFLMNERPFIKTSFKRNRRDFTMFCFYHWENRHFTNIYKNQCN